MNEMSWNRFWQVFNRIFNMERWDLLVKHLYDNWNAGWAFCRDLKYDPNSKKMVEI